MTTENIDQLKNVSSGLLNIWQEYITTNDIENAKRAYQSLTQYMNSVNVYFDIIKSANATERFS